MTYYADKNVVYDENGTVLLVVANVGFRKWVANRTARLIADHLNEFEYESADMMLGSLH